MTRPIRRMEVNGPTELSSRPERSAVEGPAFLLQFSRTVFSPYACG